MRTNKDGGRAFWLEDGVVGRLERESGEAEGGESGEGADAVRGRGVGGRAAPGRKHVRNL